MTSEWSAKTVQGALHKIGSVLKTEEGNVLKAFKVTQEITLSLNRADFARTRRPWCAKVLCFQSLNSQSLRGSPLIENRKQEEAPTCCGSSPCGLDELHVETYFQSSLCHLDALHAKILFVYSGHNPCKHIWIWKHMKRKKLYCTTFLWIQANISKVHVILSGHKYAKWYQVKTFLVWSWRIACKPKWI